MVSLSRYLAVAPVLAAVLFLSACGSSKERKISVIDPETKQVTEVTEVVLREDDGTLDFYDGFGFDYDFSFALNSADDEFTLTTPEGVNVNKIPEKLDRWLSRIKDEGGLVQARPLPSKEDEALPGELQSQAFFNEVFDVVLLLVGLIKDEAVFSAIDRFDAMIIFDRDTGKVDKIHLTLREEDE